MLKNITLSAEEDLIIKARKKAQKENTTINENFRKWLLRYVSSDRDNFDYQMLKKKMLKANAGRKFTRDEMNER